METKWDVIWDIKLQGYAIVPAGRSYPGSTVYRVALPSIEAAAAEIPKVIKEVAAVEETLKARHQKRGSR